MGKILNVVINTITTMVSINNEMLVLRIFRNHRYWPFVITRKNFLFSEGQEGA